MTTKSLCPNAFKLPKNLHFFITSIVCVFSTWANSSGNYQWQSSTNNIVWVDIPSATSANYTSASLIQNTYFRRNTVNTINGVQCYDSSNWIYAKVSPLLIGGTIDQTDQTVCSGESLATLTISGGSSGGNILYQWQKSIDGGVTYNDIPFETNSNITPGSVSVTTRFRRKTISSVGSCTVFSNDHKVIINDIFPGSLDSSQNSTICYNSIPPTITYGVLGADALSSLGTVTYQWQKSTDTGFV